MLKWFRAIQYSRLRTLRLLTNCTDTIADEMHITRRTNRPMTSIITEVPCNATEAKFVKLNEMSRIQLISRLAGMNTIMKLCCIEHGMWAIKL